MVAAVATASPFFLPGLNRHFRYGLQRLLIQPRLKRFGIPRTSSAFYHQPEVDLAIRHHRNRCAILFPRRKTPLLNRFDGLGIQAGLKRTKYVNIARLAIALYDRRDQGPLWR